MFDICHHVLAASLDIGIVIEISNGSCKEIRAKTKQKKPKKNLIIFNNKCIQVNPGQQGKKKNKISKPNSKRLKKKDSSFMKTAGSAGSIKISEFYREF